MFKKAISAIVLTVLVLTLSAPAFALEALDTSIAALPEGEFQPNDAVTFIVEVEGNPTLTSTKVSELGITGYSQTSEAETAEENNLNTQARVMSHIKSSVRATAEKGFTYTALFNGFSTNGRYGDLEVIQNLAGVKNVYVSRFRPAEKPLLSTSVEMTGAYDTAVSPYHGEGQAVAIIDSEFDTGHAFFSHDPASPRYTKDGIATVINEKGLNVKVNEVYKSAKIPFAYDYYNRTASTFDDDPDHIHGTHVAGIVGGKDGTAPDGSTFSGIAPEAQLILMKTTRDDGYFSDDAIFAALDDAAKLDVTAVNMSLGADYVSTSNDPNYDEILTNLRNAGIFLSTAAGNAGRGFQEQTPLTDLPDYAAAGTPASFSSATAVASVNNTSAPDGQAGKMTSFSSWGTSETLELKPELTAPGGLIYSSVPNDQYQTFSGTSMAAPHVTGAVALMNQFYAENPYSSAYNGLSGKERTDLIENLLMSSATVLYQDNGLPYSPRQQGAGRIDLAKAMKTKAVLIGDNGKTKISLGDQLGHEIAFSFEIQNLSDDAITFDNLKTNVVTDDFITGEDGRQYVDGTKKLQVRDHLPLMVTIPANSSKVMNVTLSLDEFELNQTLEAFPNGFFIDGFVFLSSSQAGENSSAPVSLSIPFTGFYGDWTQAPSFDTTMYDEGGSSLYLGGDTGFNGTYLATTITQSGISGSIMLGQNIFDSSIVSKDAIAISPNGDELADDLTFNVQLLRTLKQMTFDLTNEGGGYAVQPMVYNSVFVKYYTNTVSFSSLEALPDGLYTFTVGGTYDYADAQPQEGFSLPLRIDREKPEIKSAQLNAEKTQLTVTAQDNAYLQGVYISYTDSRGWYQEQTKAIDPAQTTPGSLNTVTFDVTGAQTDTIYLETYDYALNAVTGNLSDFAGNFRAELTDLQQVSGMTAATFQINNASATAADATLAAAFYDESGQMIAMSILENERLVQGYQERTFRMLKDTTKAAQVKLFVWDSLSGLRPLNPALPFALVPSAG